MVAVGRRFSTVNRLPPATVRRAARRAGLTHLLTATTTVPDLTATLNQITPVGGSLEVDWGDGSEPTIIAEDNTDAVSHLYATVGSYEIYIDHPELISVFVARDDAGEAAGPLTLGKLNTRILRDSPITWFEAYALVDCTFDSADIVGWTGITRFHVGLMWQGDDRHDQFGTRHMAGWTLLERLALYSVHIGPNYAVCEAIVAAYRAESETQARIAGLEGERDGFGDFLAAGPALVKAVDLPDVIAETRQKSPATLTVYRTRKPGDLPAGDFTGDPVAVAGAWMAQQLAAWRFVAADYFEPINEPDPSTPAKWQWLDAFTQECLRIADVWGRRLALFAFASGVPEPEELVYLLPSLRLAQAGGHALALHEYGLSGSGLLRDNAPHLATRYRQYRAVLEQHGIDLPFLITECAPHAGQDWDRAGEAAFLDDVRWYDGALRKDDYVRGVALWSLRQWEGYDANFQAVLPQLAAWIRESERSLDVQKEDAEAAVQEGTDEAREAQTGLS